MFPLVSWLDSVNNIVTLVTDEAVLVIHSESVTEHFSNKSTQSWFASSLSSLLDFREHDIGTGPV